ncbi:hypothetical protein [Rhodoblastus sphagnicola]|uniref:hypothetical protein n=1 Tax=Rhodoblastus sphagnicola TaxID=333368 RepID=UPI003CC8833C
MLLCFPLMAAIQEISARSGRVTGQGIAGNFRARRSPRLLRAMVGLLLAANIINLGPQGSTPCRSLSHSDWRGGDAPSRIGWRKNRSGFPNAWRRSRYRRSRKSDARQQSIAMWATRPRAALA